MQKSDENQRKLKEFLKSAGTKAVDIGKSTASKTSEIYSNYKNKPSDGDESSQNQSNQIPNKENDIKSLPGKISFIGRILGLFGRLFGRFSLWISNKLFYRMVGKQGIFSRMLGSRFTAFKDKVLTKGIPNFSNILS